MNFEQLKRAILTLTGFTQLQANVLRHVSELPEAERALELAVLAGAFSPGAASVDALTSWLRVSQGGLDRPMRAAVVRLTAQKLKTFAAVGTLIESWNAGSAEARLALQQEWIDAPVAPTGSAHGLYMAAAREVDAAALPKTAVHGGAPTPKPLAPGYLEVGLLLLRELRGDASPAEQKEIDAVLAQLETVTKVTIGSLPPNATRTSVPLRVLNMVCNEARTVFRAPDKVGSALRPGVKLVAQSMKGDVERQRRFLRALDAELVRLDAIASLSRLDRHTSAAVLACPWRGVVEGKVKLWLMRLAGERYALLYKPKHHWDVLEGDRDSVLASVPDALFPGAIAALIDG